MSVYDISGSALSAVYDSGGNALADAYDINGNSIFTGESDYSEYSTDYEYAIMTARDAWQTQYRADPDVIPIIVHADQHGRLTRNNVITVEAMDYLRRALRWSEVSAMIGLGDIDGDFDQMNAVLDIACDRSKQINIWGNHDLWNNYTTDENGQFAVDFESSYPNMSNETFGDESYAYNHKGIEYHIDRVHNVKYVCIGAWEIDSDIGGYASYVIGTESMAGIIDMLEMQDGNDIVILSHLPCFGEYTNVYRKSEGTDTQLTPTGSDALLDEPQAGTVATLGGSFSGTYQDLQTILAARNAYTSGSTVDHYGVTHTYDFTQCTGKIICGLNGHCHQDAYGWSTAGAIQIAFDAYAYQWRPFYFVNIDRTAETVTMWKITDDAVVQTYTVPFSDPSEVAHELNN